MENKNFIELNNEELTLIDGGFVITIGSFVVTGVAIAKGFAALGTAYMAGYTLGSHIKKAQGR